MKEGEAATIPGGNDMAGTPGSNLCHVVTHKRLGAEHCSPGNQGQGHAENLALHRCWYRQDETVAQPWVTPWEHTSQRGRAGFTA